MRYYGIVRQRKPWVTRVFFLLALCMLVLEIMQRQWIYVSAVTLALLACFFKKEHIVSEEGVDIHYILFGRPLHNVWAWSEITTLHRDAKKAAPNVILYFGKDVNTRVFVMKPEDSRAVLALARKMNPNIYIADVDDR